MQFSIVERGRLQVCDGVRQSLVTAAQITVLVRGTRLPARPLAPARTLLGSGPSLPLPESRPYLRLQPKGGRCDRQGGSFWASSSARAGPLRVEGAPSSHRRSRRPTQGRPPRTAAAITGAVLATTAAASPWTSIPGRSW